MEFSHNVLNLPMSVRERDASGQYMTGDITYTYLGDGVAVVNLSAPQSASTGAFILEQNGYHPFGTKIDQGCNLSTNRWRYAGKEEQDIAGMDLRLLDFGARFYDPYTLRWNAVDPLAHKYFNLSPYNYCGNDPVNMVDPDGLSIYTIDEDGTVELYQETDDDYDQLYVCWGEGPLDQNANSIIVNDKTILESMSKGKMLSSSTDKDQMRNIMHFAADNFSKQEWGLFYNDKNCELVTQGKSCSVKTSLEDVTWKEHSHPNAESNTNAELYSMMGCWLPEDCYTAAGDLKKGVALSKLELELNTRSDCYKVKNNNGPWVRSQVYMVKSGRTYVISPLGFPILMK